MPGALAGQGTANPNQGYNQGGGGGYGGYGKGGY